MNFKSLFANTFIVAICLNFFSCSNSNKTIKSGIKPSQINLDEWTLETVPNKLDKVGVIFGLDEEGRLVRIPGGDLQLKTNSSVIAMTEQKIKRTFGAMAQFLEINNLSDSLMSFGLDYSNKLNLNFSIKDGSLTNINDDISTGFERQRKLIESNMSVLNLDTSNIYLVLETIQSSNVNMSFDKSNSASVNAFSKIKSLFALNSKIHFNSEKSNELVYTAAEPLTIFYKLKKINIRISKIKGDPQNKIELSLGDNSTIKELLIKK